MSSRIETLAEGVTLYLGDCRESHFHAMRKGRVVPSFISRKWTALHGLHNNSRSSTARFICAISRCNDRPFALISACSFPPPPFLWLISRQRMSSQPHLTQAIAPRPTRSTARCLYRRSASVARFLGAFQALSDGIFGVCDRCLTSRIFSHLGQRSYAKPVIGLHVHWHCRHSATALIGVLVQGIRRGLSASSLSICEASNAR